MHTFSRLKTGVVYIFRCTGLVRECFVHFLDNKQHSACFTNCPTAYTTISICTVDSPINSLLKDSYWFLLHSWLLNVCVWIVVSGERDWGKFSELVSAAGAGDNSNKGWFSFQVENYKKLNKSRLVVELLCLWWLWL